LRGVLPHRIKRKDGAGAHEERHCREIN
jgi:hypothetical protein